MKTLRSRGRDGFILIAVLWLLVALGAVALDVSLRTRTRRLAAANVLDSARAHAAALAGAEYARSRLTAAMLGRADELRADARDQRRANRDRERPMDALFARSDPADDPWREPADLVATEMTFGDATFSLELRDPGAALNLNAADEETLRRFLADGLGVDYADADRLAQAILDWRDFDDLPRIGGGERDQYLRLGAAVLPANQGFQDVDDLRYVLGMTNEIFAAARPFLTLTGSGDVNVNAAPEPVLASLPGMTPGAAAAIIRLRDGGTYPRDIDDLADMLPGGAGAAIDAATDELEDWVTFATDEVEIVSNGQVTGGAVHLRLRTIVRRAPTGAVVAFREIER